MNQYSSILNGIGLNENNSAETTHMPNNLQFKEDVPQQPEVLNPPVQLFDISQFISDLSSVSETRNKMAKQNSININSYDIAHNCIREIIFKIQNYPTESYRDVWLPILMRAYLGNAVHDFIQNSYKGFTELECSVKVPSVRASTRLDALINDNVLVEIKSCTYTDYYKIINHQKPRDADFLQTVFYKYLLENHLQEAQSQKNTRSSPPKLKSYNIQYIQLIYAAHDVCSADCNSLSESINVSKKVKKMLNSRRNQFHYITSITLDLSKIDITPYTNYVVGKLNNINDHLNRNVIPPMNNPYINSKGCYFCIYKNICSQYGG